MTQEAGLDPIIILSYYDISDKISAMATMLMLKALSTESGKYHGDSLIPQDRIITYNPVNLDNKKPFTRSIYLINTEPSPLILT